MVMSCVSDGGDGGSTEGKGNAGCCGTRGGESVKTRTVKGGGGGGGQEEGGGGGRQCTPHAHDTAQGSGTPLASAGGRGEGRAQHVRRARCGVSNTHPPTKAGSARTDSDTCRYNSRYGGGKERTGKEKRGGGGVAASHRIDSRGCAALLVCSCAGSFCRSDRHDAPLAALSHVRSAHPRTPPHTVALARTRLAGGDGGGEARENWTRKRGEGSENLKERETRTSTRE